MDVNFIPLLDGRVAPALATVCPCLGSVFLKVRWVAPPRGAPQGGGINGQPFDYDYVHLA